MTRFHRPAGLALPALRSIRLRRSHAVVLGAFLLLVGGHAQLSASTVAPPPFEFINGLIAFLRRAAVPSIVVALMCCALAWLFTRNGEGIVQWAGRALTVLAILLGTGTLLSAIGFQGAVL
jgi:hypothetical protein